MKTGEIISFVQGDGWHEWVDGNVRVLKDIPDRELFQEWIKRPEALSGSAFQYRNDGDPVYTPEGFVMWAVREGYFEFLNERKIDLGEDFWLTPDLYKDDEQCQS